MALMKEYMKEIGNTHDILSPYSKHAIDFEIRMIIGKDYETPESICCHDAIIARELGEGFCRICHIELKDGVGRFNDYLFLRNKRCPSAICSDCAENKPDSFYKIYKKALEIMALKRKPI